MGCFLWLALLPGAVFVMATLLRWFEQTADAVERRWWNKVFVLVVMPFSVWFFPSRVRAGRATAVPKHEPVLGFGGTSKKPSAVNPVAQEEDVPFAKLAPPGELSGQAPPGTPPEFMGMPVIPVKRRKEGSQIDPEKVAKLKQKMREQGMLGEDK